MKKTSLFIFFFIFSLITFQISFAYDGELTHPGITEQIVEFYNLNNDIKINSTDKELIIQGSIDEDIGGRPLNHFYEPQRGMGINNYRNAIEWVTEENNGNEFTWGKSIEKYAKGDREGALIALGHILHVIQDMTVPDHTRNDPHLGEGGLKGLAGTGNSLYEDWAKENQTRETMSGIADYYKNLNLKPRRAFGSIEEYFRNVAAYSNNNYVSPDTIDNNKYPGPKVVEKREGYVYGEDTYFYDRHKLYAEYYSKKFGLRKGLINEDTLDFSVLEEYFPRLAKMAILSGVGVVEMFFAEAENARAEYLEAERIKQEKITAYETEKNSKLTDGGLFSKIWYRISYAVTDTSKAVASAVTNTASSISSVLYNGSSYAINFTKNNTSALTYTSTELATVGVKKVKKAVVSNSEKVILYVKANAANFPSLLTPAVVYTPLVSNPNSVLTPTQIAQLVTILQASSDTNKNKEVFEKNELIAKKVHSRSGGSSRETAEEVVAMLVEEIEEEIVIDSSTTTEEIVDDISTTTDDIIDDDIATTSEDTLLTIDVSDPAQCEDSILDDSCLITDTSLYMTWNATGGELDYFVVLLDDELYATTTDTEMTIDLDDGYESYIEIFAVDIDGTETDHTIFEIIVYTMPVVINEVAWMGTATSTNDEWMELYNNTNYDIDLTNWFLKAVDGTPNIPLSGTISANDFYFLERTDDTTVSDIPADQIYSGALGNDGEELILFFGEQVIDQTPAGTWPAGDNDAKASMERKEPWMKGDEGESWITNLNYFINGLDAGEGFIIGTPRMPNSSTYPPALI